MTTEHTYHPESSSSGYVPSTSTDAKDKAEHARDFADQARDSAAKGYAGSTTPSSTTGKAGTSYVSHVPGSDVEAADRPSRSGGSTVQQDASSSSQDPNFMQQAANKAKGMVSDFRAPDMGEMAEKAKGMMNDLRSQDMGEVAGMAGEKADSAMTAAGQQMENFATLVRDRAPEGKMGEFATGAADALKRGGDYLERSDLTAVRGDLETMIRRYPVHSLAIGLGVGFLLARAMRR